MNRLLSFSIRISNTGIRFLFILWIAKELTTTDAGSLYLAIAFVDFFVYLTGFDIYTYLNKIYVRDVENRGAINRYHIFCIAIITLMQFVILAAGNTALIKPFSTEILFIATSEFAIIEYYRRRITVGKITSATLLLFVKQCGWPIAIVAINEYIDLDYRGALTIWMTANLAILAVLFVINFNALMKIVFKIKANGKIWGWLKIGILASLGMYGSAIATRGMLYIDKYYVSHFFTDKLAPYAFLFSIATTVLTAVEAYAIPNMIHEFSKKNETKKLNILLKKYLIECGVIAASASLLIYFLTPWILLQVSKEEYGSQIHLVPYFVAISFSRAISYPYQYYFYAKDKIVNIFIASASTILLFIIAMIGYQPSNLYSFAKIYCISWFAMPSVYVWMFLLQRSKPNLFCKA